MPDSLDSNGLTISSLSEILANLESSLKSIYGSDINTDPDTPDGQAINIFAQAAIDLREVLQSIYSSMDPDQAQGAVLDQRAALNGLKRNGGTFTQVYIDLTMDRSVTLVGLDSDAGTINVPNGCYTVKDNAGNQWYLAASGAFAIGVHTLLFQAANLGNVAVTLNTINTAVTAIAGVTAINNSQGAFVQGVDEESDAAFRSRRNVSLANSASGYLDSLEGNLLSISGVTAAVVNENHTDTTDGNGIPPHSIWAIVEGGSNTDIANMLYAKKTAGAGFKGAVEVDILRTLGRIFPVLFDRPISENLYVKFTLSRSGGGTIDKPSIVASILANIFYNLGQSAIGSIITAYVMVLDPKYIVSGMLLSSDNTNWYEIVAPTTLQYQFIMATARITIS